MKMTIDEMAKEVANRAKRDLTVNDMSLEEFIVNVNRVCEMANEKIKASTNTELIIFCNDILNVLNAEHGGDNDERHIE